MQWTIPGLHLALGPNSADIKGELGVKDSEVKRRSADGSVGSPHARVGNCQASNKTKGPVGRQGFLFLSV
ncbi:hypothetical protein MJM04_34585, partial [Salmonella enterica subsp. enterica serovar Cerro]|nr:hypothetical protein [Salmonella enterica subsp. enterica serovar Cerro]